MFLRLVGAHWTVDKLSYRMGRTNGLNSEQQYLRGEIEGTVWSSDPDPDPDIFVPPRSGSVNISMNPSIREQKTKKNSYFYTSFQIFKYVSCIFAHIQWNFLNIFKKISRKTKIVFRETRELKFSCGFPYRSHLSSCPPPPLSDWSPASSHFRPGSLLLTQPATHALYSPVVEHNHIATTWTSEEYIVCRPLVKRWAVRK